MGKETKFSLTISKYGNQFLAISQNKGISKAEVILVIKQWSRAYKDNFLSSVSTGFIEDEDND